MKQPSTNSFEELIKNIIKKLNIPITADKNPILLLSTLRNLKHENGIFNQNKKIFQIDKYQFKFEKNQRPEFGDLFCQIFIVSECVKLLEKIVENHELDIILKNQPK